MKLGRAREGDAERAEARIASGDGFGIRDKVPSLFRQEPRIAELERRNDALIDAAEAERDAADALAEQVEPLAEQVERLERALEKAELVVTVASRCSSSLARGAAAAYREQRDGPKPRPVNPDHFWRIGKQRNG